ncbi:MAG: dihydrolipoyl dehydrogenase [Nitrospirae bacterium]|nr:dihydrolipoyl dehydrogenase [Nitrospirota bacterium]
MKLTVIGSGPGGYVAALKAARLGAQVTVIEDSEVGGTCLNVGCIPTKSLIASIEVLRKARRLDEYGIDLKGEIHPNLAGMMERKDKVVATNVRGIRALFKSWGITLVEGRGMLRGPSAVEVRKKDSPTELIETDKIIIATGSRPALLPMFPPDGQRILSSDHAIAMKSVPASMIIIGAGIIGCEFACIFRELGTEITMVEMMPGAISTEDTEISSMLERELKKKKIRLITGVRVDSSEVGNNVVNVSLSNGVQLTAEKLLVSIGRSLNTENIGLEALDIRRGPRGEIQVNNRMETNVDGIYAVGDVIGGPLLAHVASMEGIVAAFNACGLDKRMDYSVIPAGIFTSPEIGSVGLREQQAAEKGINVKIGRFQFRMLGKAHAMGELTGMVKILADAATRKVLGVHIIGAHASELVHEGALAMQAGLTVETVAEMIHSHPTLSECIMECAADVNNEAIHALKPNA